MNEQPGEVLAERTVRLDRAALRAYADASGDQNPIHRDEAVAVSVGLPGVIAHGMLTMGLAVQPVVDWLAARGGRILDYGVRFSKMVVVDAESGAEVRTTARLATVDPAAGTARVDLTVTSLAADGTEQTVLTKAQVTVALEPLLQDREP